MNKTGIEYLDYSYNPIAMRCTPVSAGCANCWHLRMADRLAKNPKLPAEERAAYAGEGPPVLKQRELEAPLRRKKSAVIGLQFMGDVGHESIDYTHLTQIFNMMQTCNNHVFLALTKRPQTIATFMDWWLYPYRESSLSIDTVLPNVWWGVTVENQDTMWRIEEMFKIPAARYWVSFEPLLGWVDVNAPSLVGLAGVVVGGESGLHARPMRPIWARRVRDACMLAGTLYTFKQWGQFAPKDAISENEHLLANANDRWGTVGPDGKFLPVTTPFTTIDLKTGEMTKDPEETVMYDVGKKAAGRLLDGKIWNEFPWRLLDD